MRRSGLSVSCRRPLEQGIYCLQGLSRGALLAPLAGMFAISVGYSIVVPVLPFLIERLAGAGVTEGAALGRITAI